MSSRDTSIPVVQFPDAVSSAVVLRCGLSEEDKLWFQRQLAPLVAAEITRSTGCPTLPRDPLTPEPPWVTVHEPGEPDKRVWIYD